MNIYDEPKNCNLMESYQIETTFFRLSQAHLLNTYLSPYQRGDYHRYRIAQITAVRMVNVRFAWIR